MQREVLREKVIEALREAGNPLIQSSNLFADWQTGDRKRAEKFIDCLLERL